MNDNELASLKFLDNLPDFLLWQLFEKTGRPEYYIKYSQKTSIKK